MEKYAKILQEKFISPSIQRVSVLRYLDLNRCHPTVEDIYLALKKSLPTLSKTTVYNVLELLEKKKIIKSISGADAREHFDFNRAPHGHFQCIRCGKVFDVKTNFVYKGGQMIEGHKISDYNLVFKGVCKHCLAHEQQIKDSKGVS